MAITYQPQYRLHATTTWINWGSPISATSATIGSPATPLTASTQYDVQVIAINSFGSTTSNLISATTASGVTISSIVLTGSKAFTTGTNNAVVGTIAVTLSSGAFTGVLSLAGADALSFQIVNVSGTNTLETKGSLSTARTYTVNIVADQPGAANTPLTGPPESIVGSTGTGSVVPVTPPINLPTGWQIAFFDDFTTSNTVTTNTSGNGFNWFLNIGGRTPNYSILTTTHASGISNGNTSGGSNASSAGGLWRQAGTNVATDYNGVWTTCPGDNATTGVSGKNNYWKHAYFEAYLQWNASGWSGVSGAWFPAFWSWSVNPSPVQCEIDFMEQFQRASTDNPNHTVSWGTSDPGGVPAGAVVRSAVYESSHDNQWHTIACLWQSTGTGQGTLRFFMDGTQFGATQVTGSATGSTMVDLENTVAMHMTMGSGFNWDLYIDWVRVWTATGT